MAAIQAALLRLGQGTGTPCTTGVPAVGSSSVACETPSGVITSMACATALGSTEQIGDGSPTAQTPNWNCCGVGAKVRANPSEEPSWPVSTTLNAHPEPTVPSC